MRRDAPRRRLVALACVLGLAAAILSPADARADGRQIAKSAEWIDVRRTTDGIPHILAPDWRTLGVGVGYAQAQDALCTLAEAFVTFEGQRSWFFGGERRPVASSGIGRPRNIDSDFFFRAFADREVTDRFRHAQPVEMTALVGGFADGYNRHVREVRRRPSRHAHRPCAREPWLREISSNDIYRRMVALMLMSGYLQFLPDIVNAKPGGRLSEAGTAALSGDLRTRMRHNIGVQAELGSNAIAWGSQATGGDSALLFGNPHWYWGGPDRLYQMHLTIPGVLNVAGAGFLGVPLVMIGFNERVAWTHTVSRARRFGLFQLQLDPADPTRYLVDGVSEPMQSREITVAVRDEGGARRMVRRVLRVSRHGPLVDLSRLNAALGWTAQQALAIRDINSDNFRAFRNFLAWGRAISLDEFVRIQREEVAMPWVNTVAIGQGDGRVWYADIGAVPNVQDDFRRTCAAPLSEAFARFDSRTPLLDGSRSACAWPLDAHSAQSGAMAPSRLPGLFRNDYVANMNDSHWLANVYQPLEGYAAVLGEERTALSLRGRFGHQIAIELLQRSAGSSAQLARMAQRVVLDSRAYSAKAFKLRLLDQTCMRETQKSSEAHRLEKACKTLREWHDSGEVHERGALLWDAFWQELEKLPDNRLYGVPFSPDRPLTTPASPMPPPGQAIMALDAAVRSLAKNGIALDASPAEQRYARSDGRRVPIYGGCGAYFTAACPADDRYVMDVNAIANSYLQLVWFDQDGPQARTLLAHGQDELAVSGGRGSAPVDRYARKEWLRFPFREEDIQRDPRLSHHLIRP